ncbi:MAG: MMPL family transporter, partial [Arcanobacterium sp.]|nr:MMPL family transporter [Arcanobacterium sp.]
VKRGLESAAQQLEQSDPSLDTRLSGNIGATAGVELSIIEAFGVLIAAVVLLVTFGSLRAAGIPIMTAILGVGVGMLGILIAASFTDINAVTPVLAVMIGLAVGIDYALFIINRAREYLGAGLPPAESAGRAVATAGSAVVFAGMTVVIALCGLAIARIPFLTAMGISAAFMVTVAVGVAITAVPAFLGILSKGAAPRKRPWKSREARHYREQHAASEAPSTASASSGKSEASDDLAASNSQAVDAPSSSSESRIGRAWITMIMKAPIVFTVLVIAILGVASIPVKGVSLSLVDNGYEPRGTTMRDTYDAISDTFGEGYNAPIIVIADIVQSTDPLGLVGDVSQELEALPGVEKIALGTPNPDGSLGFFQVIPEGGQASPRTTALVEEIREMAPSLESRYGISNVMVTGVTAVAIDIANTLDAALLPFGIVVVGLSLILLMIVFRSIAVPITATLGYLLSLGTGMGAVGAIFGWGWFAEALNVTKVGSVISFLPVIVMGILFGLAMDYEVFLVSRMRETWIHTRDARRAVRDGFIGSAKVVTAAALIMTSVFAFFIPGGNKYIKPIAVALTVGIFADAFLVRMTFIPAVMTMLGTKAWWIPKFLDRILPMVDVEGDGLARSLEHRDWEAKHGSALVRLSGVSLRDDQGSILSDTTMVVRPGEFAYIRINQVLGRGALAAIVAGRTHPTGGIAVVDGSVLPDGIAAIQASTYVLTYPDAGLVPRHTKLAIAVDPIPSMWAVLAELHDRGTAALAVIGPNVSIPSQYLPLVRNAAESIKELGSDASYLGSQEGTTAPTLTHSASIPALATGETTALGTDAGDLATNLGGGER